MDDDDQLLTVADVETLYRIPAGTQRWWRMSGQHLGLLSFKIGSRVVYRRSEVAAWVAEQEKATRPNRLHAV